MNFAEIKAQLRGLINRSDMTDDLAKQFVNMAQVRLERLLRTSFMQKYVSFSVPGDDGVFRVPVDYLELIELFTDTCGGEMEPVDLTTWLKYPATAGTPQVFIRTGHEFRLRPYPATTDTLYLRYYGSEPALVTDDDQNQWSVAASDALVYGAAEFAADHFEDERLERFATRFNATVAELQDQQLQEDFSGPMRVQPAYSFPSDY